MPLMTTDKMLKDAIYGQYAIGAFNVENMEMVKAVVAAAEELKAPVILQTTPSTVRYGKLEMFAAIVAAEAKECSVPVALHLDHGDSYELAIKALQVGYTSVMIDGSGLPFEDNIQVSTEVMKVARVYGIPVEAELGKVGGKEDDLDVAADTNTDPDEARLFAAKTGVNSLAIAIGTAHGFYSGVPVLDKQRISDIKKLISIPLVLHGASGISDNEVLECIKRGICKVNFATELRAAYTYAIKMLLNKEPETFDPKKLGEAGMAAVKQLVIERIKVCGCEGKAG